MGGAIRHIAENPENSAKIVEYSAPIELVYDEIHFPNSFIHQLEVGRAIRMRQDEGGNAMLWAACVANAMRRKPSLILIGEARDAQTIEGCVTAAMTGHGVMSTMHTIGVAETLRRAIMALPVDQRASVAIDLMEMSSMYVTQLLVPGLKRGRVAVREYIKFDATTRRKIVAQPLESWTSLIQNMMKNGEVESQRMIDAAERLYEAGEIDDVQLDFLSARQREADRVQPVNPRAPQIAISSGDAGVPFDPNADAGFDFSRAEVGGE
jgi:defect-in-organelle-trafficking protein DotB